MAKRKQTPRARGGPRRADPKRANDTVETARRLHRRLRRWRVLKAEFDRVHRAGVAALRQQNYDRLHAAIAHERRIIIELRTLIDEARGQVQYWTTK
jgi:hypothetical protein